MNRSAMNRSVMNRSVAWALPELTVESDFMRQAQEMGLAVVRRCIDAVELLAVTAVQPGLDVLISAKVPRMSADTFATLVQQSRRVVVLIFDESDDKVARSWGASERVAITAAVASLSEILADSGVEAQVLDEKSADSSHLQGREGQVDVIWSHSGSPGRTTVAITLAEAHARRGARVLLIDADTVGPAIAMTLGVVEDLSGVIVACRYAESHSLDARRLASTVRALSPHLWLMSGIPHSHRWPEVRPQSFARVIQTARTHFDRIIIDVSAGSDSDFAGDGYLDGTPESLAGLSINRQSASVTALSNADRILMVTRPDAVGASRVMARLEAARGLIADTPVEIVLNKVSKRNRHRLISEFAELGAARLDARADGRDFALWALPTDDLAGRMVERGQAIGEMRAKSPLFRGCRDYAVRAGS